MYHNACFVDLKSVFDTVWRDGLFYKKLKMGIGGNFIKVLQSMYAQTKYAVKADNTISEPFVSSVGCKTALCPQSIVVQLVPVWLALYIW